MQIAYKSRSAARMNFRTVVQAIGCGGKRAGEKRNPGRRCGPGFPKVGDGSAPQVGQLPCGGGRCRKHGPGVRPHVGAGAGLRVLHGVVQRSAFLGFMRGCGCPGGVRAQDFACHRVAETGRRPDSGFRKLRLVGRDGLAAVTSFFFISSGSCGVRLSIQRYLSVLLPTRA